MVSIKQLTELKHLHIESAQFQITQDLIDTLSLLKKLMSFYIITKMPLNAKFMNFKPLKLVKAISFYLGHAYS